MIRASSIIAGLILFAALPHLARGEGDRDLGLFAVQNGKGDQLKTLAAVDGEVRLLRAQIRPPVNAVQPKKYPYREGSLAWKITRTAKGYTLQATGEGMKHRGWYLSFDREQPKKGVFLTQEATAGSYWKIDELPAFTERDATPLRPTIAGAEWKLDFDPDGETYLREAGITGHVIVYQLKLVEGRGTRWVVDFFGK